MAYYCYLRRHSFSASPFPQLFGRSRENGSEFLAKENLRRRQRSSNRRCRLYCTSSRGHTIDIDRMLGVKVATMMHQIIKLGVASALTLYIATPLIASIRHISTVVFVSRTSKVSFYDCDALMPSDNAVSACLLCTRPTCCSPI